MTLRQPKHALWILLAASLTLTACSGDSDSGGSGGGGKPTSESSANNGTTDSDTSQTDSDTSQTDSDVSQENEDSSDSPSGDESSDHAANDNNDGSDEPVPVGGNHVEGPLDPLQEALGFATNNNISVIGDTSDELFNALIALLDVPDALLASYQTFAMNQDPDALLAGGEDAGDALLSFQAGLAETLRQLVQEGEAFPGSDRLIQLLDDLARQVRDGTTGESEGGDLSDITDLLSDIHNELRIASENVPDRVENAPLVSSLFAVLAAASDNVANILDKIGRLDGDATSVALTRAINDVVSQLDDASPQILPDSFEQRLENRAQTASAAFEQGLALLLDPVFQSLRGVLAPVTGEQAPLRPVLDGLFARAGDGVIGLPGFGFGDLRDQFDNPVQAFREVITGAIPRSDGTDTPRPEDVLSGIPLLGDLIAGLAEGDFRGGRETLRRVLENDGDGNLPSLGEVLQNRLNAPDGTGNGPSLPVVEDLISALMSLNDERVPVIQRVLDNADGDGGSFRNALGNILERLLDRLVGRFGGRNPDGGFLPDDRLFLPDVVHGLLDRMLGLQF